MTQDTDEQLPFIDLAPEEDEDIGIAESDQTFGTKLKALRTAQGMTQVELAKRIRVTQGYIAQLERGIQKDPSLSTLRRLAKALKCSITELVE